mmetsp:Transcript_9455/g.23217  ORF Transcript_9455/g.23217 Transcript_9455/m.23217 type:complete len:256 (-) Transcript_9455:987-1754(-)
MTLLVLYTFESVHGVKSLVSWLLFFFVTAFFCNFVFLLVPLLKLESKIVVVEPVLAIAIIVRIGVRVGSCVLIGGVFVRIQLRQVDLPSKGATDAPKSLYELCSLGGSVRDEFEIATEVLVVFGEPLYQWRLIHGLQFDTRLFVAEVFVLRLLLFVEVQDLFLLRLDVSDQVTLNLEVIPDYQVFNGTHLESLQCIINHETEATRVLGNMVEILLKELLFLHQLDVRKGIGTEFDGLVESVLATVADIDHLDHDF